MSHLGNIPIYSHLLQPTIISIFSTYLLLLSSLSGCVDEYANQDRYSDSSTCFAPQKCINEACQHEHALSDCFPNRNLFFEGVFSSIDHPFWDSGQTSARLHITSARSEINHRLVFQFLGGATLETLVNIGTFKSNTHRVKSLAVWKDKKYLGMRNGLLWRADLTLS